MKLDLVLVRDYLRNATITDSDCHAGTVRFEQPLCYQGGPMTRNALYVCEETALSEIPPFRKSDHISVIVLGQIPPSWIGRCEYICISPESTTFYDLVNSVSSVFLFFQKWEQSLNMLIRSGASLHELGEAFFEVFDNPIEFVTNFFKEVILVTDPKRKHPPLWLSFYHEGEFLEDDEVQIIFADKEYQDSLSTRGPAMFSAAIYGFRMLYQNLFIQDEYIGRLTISEIFHEFRESDLSLIPIVCEYLLDVYQRTEMQNIGLSGRMENMVQALLDGGDYLQEYDELLAARNWRRNNSYICLSIKQRQGSKKVSMSTSAVYLAHVLPLCMIYGQKDRIVVVFNETQSKSSSSTLGQIEQFCQKNNFAAGASLAFCDFSQLKSYSAQADDALRLGPKITPGRNIYFSQDLLLDRLVDAVRQTISPAAYTSRQVRQLMEYDKKHKTKLCKTLFISLQNNMNIIRSAKKLSLSRTAYLYRTQRIEELTGYDLNDYRTRLYLMLLFELEPEELLDLID